MKKLLIGIICFSALTTLHATTQPKFTIIPTTPTTVQIPINGSATVKYTVTNQTKITRTLMMVPIDGITQTTTGTGVCPMPFTLARNQSCLLTLEINGNGLPERIVRGPEICKTQDTEGTIPDRFLCSQPTLEDSLNITIIREPLSVNPTRLTLIAGDAAGQITVTNHSKVRTIRNIAANFTGTALTGNVIQDATNCISLEPNESCVLKFTPKLQSVTRTSFPILGTNTRPVSASIEIINPTQAEISVAGSPLILPSGTPTLIVTNHSQLLTATNITADISGDLTNAGVTEDATDCLSVAPGDSCALTFTPGTTAVPPVSVIVQGDNTSQTSAQIGVDVVTQAPIKLTGGSPLALQVNGNSGTMTIKNNSTENVSNVTSYFTGALNGAVTSSTCAPISPGGTCTLTFTPGSTAVVQPINFSIYGTNTTTETGAISIGSFAYVTLVGTNTVGLCPLNANGSLGTCQNSGSSGVAFNASQGVVLNSARTIAYFTNQNADMVLRCPINSDGTLGACQDSGNTGVAITQPVGIALNSTGDKAYITNYNGRVPNQQMTLCPVNANGSFGACVNTGSGFTGASAVALNTHPSAGTKAYIVGVSAVSICNVDSGTGLLSGCGDSGAGNIFSGSQGMALNGAGTSIYVTNRNTNTVSLCSVSLTDGTLSGCKPTGSGFSGPAGIALNSSGNTVYIANIGTSRLSTCSINPDGSFDSCTQTGISGNPSALALLQN